MYTDKQIAGLGKNYLKEQSRVAAIETYTYYTQYYALRGLYTKIGQSSVEQVEADLKIPAQTGATHVDSRCACRNQMLCLRSQCLLAITVFGRVCGTSGLQHCGSLMDLLQLLCHFQTTPNSPAICSLCIYLYAAHVALSVSLTISFARHFAQFTSINSPVSIHQYRFTSINSPVSSHRY